MTELGKSPILTPITEESSISIGFRTPNKGAEDSYCSARSFTPSIDDVPILPAIDGKKLKTFEDLLDEALKKHPAYSDPVVSNRPKQPFLRKGSGLARFASPQKSPRKSPAARSCSRNLFNVNPQSTTRQVDRVIRKPQRLCSSSQSTASPETVVKKVTSKIASQKIHPVRTTIRDTFRRASCPKSSEKPTNLPKSQPRKSTSGIVSQYSPNFRSIVKNKLLKSNDIVSREPVLNQNESPKKKSVTKISPRLERNNNDNEDRIKVLQRLLHNIRLKQEELILGLENNKHASEDECDSEVNSDCESLVSSTLSEKDPVRRIQRKDSLDDETESNQMDPSDDEQNLLTFPKLNSTIELKNKIEFLEQKLKDLNLKCQKDSNRLSKNSDDVKGSPKLMNEVNAVKRQLELLTDKLDILQANLMKRNSSPVKNNNTKLRISQTHTKITNPYQFRRSEIDKKITLEDGDEIVKTADDKIIYSYKNGVRQTAYPDGSRLIEFPSGQREKISSDGTKIIHYSDGIQRTINIDGTDEIIISDGTKIKIAKDGTETVELPNGEREIRTDKYKKREYLDGTVKILHTNGNIETRFTNGRTRIKNKQGKVISDTALTQAKSVS